MADYLNIAGRVRTTASDGVAMEAQEVKDLNLNKSQQEINADVQTELGDRYTKEETYSKEQLDELITTPDVTHVSVVATNATTAADIQTLINASGEGEQANTIYRVGNWNGTQYDPTMYALFAWNGTTYVCLAVRSFVGEVYDISVNHPDGQGNPTPYADLAAALGTSGANIPADIRRGGMSIKFIQGTAQSSDNKYIQYICTSQNFSTTSSDWQLAVGIEELRNNYYDVVPGVYLATNGKEVNSASYNASSFIKVTANALYFCDTPHNICIYDITKKFIELATVSSHTFTTSANAYYVRFSYPTSKNPVFYAVDSRRYRERACDLWAEKIDSLAFSLRWTKNGYYSYTDGSWNETNSYRSTNFIEINSEHRIYMRSAIYNYFNKNYEWISGGGTAAGSILEIPEATKYIVVSKSISSTINEIMIDFDDPTFNIAQRSDTNSNDIFPKEIHCNFKDNDYKEYGIKLVSGQAGSVGAVYSVPIKYDGKYAMRIRYKMPRSIQGSTVTQFTLAQMRAWKDATHTQGGIRADLVSGMPTANPPYQQAKYNAYVRVGATSSYTGNYSALFRPMHRFSSSQVYTNCKPWVGEDVFSIRYLGDISVAANQDVVYSISSQGLVVKHSTDDSIILSEAFPVSDSLRDFMQTLYTKTQEGGDYYGIIEFDFLSGENLKCSDLIEVTDIPMVGNYTSDSATKGVQAFPCFVNVYDDSEHTIEFRYNGTVGAYDENTWGSEANYMRYMFAVLFDGKYVRFTDPRVEAYSDPSYKGKLQLGCSDVLITGFDFTADKTQLWSPRIHIYMGHALSDGVVTSTPALTSVGQMEGIIELHKKYGFQYVSLEEISKYMNGEELPSRDVYTIIHDDYHYLADDSGVARKFRDLYTKNDIKAAFAIINEYNSQYYDEIKSDATLFGFHLHDIENYPVYGYEALISRLRQEAETFRTNAFDTNIFTYPGGRYDDNIVHIMKKEGFAICTIVGGGAASLANYPNSLPRTNTADVATSLASIEDELKFDVSL